MRLRVMMAIAFVAGAVCCFPPGAQADAHYLSLPAGKFLHVELMGSNGYSIHIGAGQQGLRPGVHLETRKEGVTTDYGVRGKRVSANRVEAKLPGLGSIAIRFHQRGPARHSSPLPQCHGPRPTVRKGVVRGTIDFAGEREYTQVAAHSAQAELVEWGALRCRYSKSPRGNRRKPWTNEFGMWDLKGFRRSFPQRSTAPEFSREVESSSPSGR
jgi:hypothetical protein